MIRYAVRDDLPALAELVAEASAELAANHGTPTQTNEIMAGIEFGIVNDGAVFVAEDEGRLIGFCAWVALPGLARGLVMGLGTYVVPEHRRSQLSAKLRDYAADHCRRMGEERVQGVAAVGNTAAIRSVQAAGFKIVGHLVELTL